jgi:hypothetical protein
MKGWYQNGLDFELYDSSFYGKIVAIMRCKRFKWSKEDFSGAVTLDDVVGKFKES